MHRATDLPPPVQASSSRDRSQSAIEGKVSARTTLKNCHGADANFSESVCKERGWFWATLSHGQIKVERP